MDIPFTYPKIFIADARMKGENKVFGLTVPPSNNPRDCKNCAGIGAMFAFYAEAGPFDHPPATRKPVKWIEGKWYIGETREEECPVCQGAMVAYRLQETTRLDGSDLDIRIDHFLDLPGKEAARDVAINILSQAPAPAGFYTFYGDYGRGKSMLLKAITNGFREADTSAVYSTMAEALASVREFYGNDKTNAAEKLIEKFQTIRVLCLDEVDRINLTEWSKETMFRLLDYRYAAQDRMLTVLATNQAPDNLPEQLHYLASRMTEGMIVEVGGEDIRPGVAVRREMVSAAAPAGLPY